MRIFVVCVSTVLATAGCGGAGESGSNTAAVDRGGSNTAVAAVAVPDACTFFSRAELESAVGAELRDGTPEDVPAGSSCVFESPPAMYATRKFPNPPLPPSAGFSGLTVTTYPAASAEQFAQGKSHPGAEPVPGLADDAYFSGFNMIQVRAGSRGFSLRAYADAQSPADQAKVRSAILALARTGVSRL